VTGRIHFEAPKYVRLSVWFISCVGKCDWAQPPPHLPRWLWLATLSSSPIQLIVIGYTLLLTYSGDCDWPHPPPHLLRWLFGHALLSYSGDCDWPHPPPHLPRWLWLAFCTRTKECCIRCKETQFRNYL
jgi:hypothetical protein